MKRPIIDFAEIQSTNPFSLLQRRSPPFILYQIPDPFRDAGLVPSTHVKAFGKPVLKSPRRATATFAERRRQSSSGEQRFFGMKVLLRGRICRALEALGHSCLTGVHDETI